MLNPKILKKVILNPTAEQKKGLIMLDASQLFHALVRKVAGSVDGTIKPFVVTDKHIRIFISNVRPKVTSIQQYTGKQIDDEGQAQAYFLEVGNQIYGTGWLINLLKIEIELGKGSAFGIQVSTNKQMISLMAALKDFVDYEVGEIVQEVKTEPQGKNKKQETKQPTEKDELKGNDNE